MYSTDKTINDIKSLKCICSLIKLRHFFNVLYNFLVKVLYGYIVLNKQIFLNKCIWFNRFNFSNRITCKIFFLNLFLRKIVAIVI